MWMKQDCHAGRQLQKTVDHVLVRHYKEVEMLRMLGLIVRFDLKIPKLSIIIMSARY